MAAQQHDLQGKGKGKGKALVATNINDKAALLKDEKDAVSGAFRRVSSIDLPGHRSDIRSVSFSSDDTLLMSTSSGT